MGLGVILMSANCAIRNREKRYHLSHGVIDTMNAYDKVYALAKEQVLIFPDFEFKYMGQVDANSGSAPKTTAVVLHRQFVITDKAGKEQILEVTHGQLPPAAKEFSVNESIFILHTYNSPTGERLFPDKIMIEKK